MDLEKLKKDLNWVLAVLKSSSVRVDQHELHTRLSACVEKIAELTKELSENETDNEQK